jgi:hypothetical protein
MKIGNSSLYDTTIAPGDKFMLYSDNHYDSSNVDYASSDNGKYLVWHPKGITHGMGVQFGTRLKYMIIDRDSDKVMATGSVVFR